MAIYTAEIEGRAIVAFHAEREAEAMDLADAEWLQADLVVLESDGRPLWNGTSAIHIRKARGSERAEWESSRARAVLAKEIENKNDWLVYLVDARDPTDDD